MNNKRKTRWRPLEKLRIEYLNNLSNGDDRSIAQSANKYSKALHHYLQYFISLVVSDQYKLLIPQWWHDEIHWTQSKTGIGSAPRFAHLTRRHREPKLKKSSQNTLPAQNNVSSSSHTCNHMNSPDAADSDLPL